jgi:hypothetical protein
MKWCKRQATGKSAAHIITKAVTSIRLEEVNPGKLVALNDIVRVYLPLCQQYVTLFCSEEMPDKFRATCFMTPLSERWQRVAIQQAAGIAKSWRTNREQAYQDYLEELAEYEEQQANGTLGKEAIEPLWNEWDVPTLRQTCIQANTDVVVLESSHDSTFDYWLKISTLEFRKPLFVPIKLAAYHRKTLEGKAINTSVMLNKRSDGWWLTLSYERWFPSRPSRHPQSSAWMWALPTSSRLVPASTTAPFTGSCVNDKSVTGKSDGARRSCAGAWRRRASRVCPQPGTRAGSVWPAMCDRRSTARSASALPSTPMHSSPTNSFLLQR